MCHLITQFIYKFMPIIARYILVNFICIAFKIVMRCFLWIKECLVLYMIYVYYIIFEILFYIV